MASRFGRGAAVITAAGLALSVAACGSSSTKTSPAASTPASASSGASSAAISVPAAIKSKGTLTVATDAPYAPNEFFDTDGKTIIGLDVDLVNAIGKKLGLTMKITQAGFDSIIPGLASGKYDVAVSSITDSKDREKTVDLVTYLEAGSSLLVKKGNPENITPDTLCGKKIAAEKGTVQADTDIPARSKTCTDAGKAAISALTYPDQAGVNLALSSGRVDGGLADSPVNAYAAKQSNGQFEVSGSTYDTAPYGIAVPKTSGLAEPVLEAVKALIADGTYKTILAKWGQTPGAITDPKINGAVS